MPLRPIFLSILITMSSMACAPADADKPIGDTPVPQAASTTPQLADTIATPQPTPGSHHGNWRLVAVDDPHDAALMAFSVQSDRGDAHGTGDYVLFQPFCDAVAGTPITGTAECELIGLGAAFDRVDIDGERIVLVFHPTADGLPHRLELRSDGAALIGDYVTEGNDIRRAVRAQPAIEE
ncbi:hypothetical protein [Thermomonas carbonis]|uniref:Copper resistance protein NlpE N-terminal domain-containing protein n=1 Tax=Thermomonas carbonis TaxID=1463158 RepID=A0A7G9SQD9_9GAMM|nr:hypothetical protein [Thermomonas carbonis]QNN70064.1 hypothetical protein H9L16_15860 [Thermomonas carbonis]GHB97494.1 hypothetical protein GCM10010080_07040 [Thermomonas carbonis]